MTEKRAHINYGKDIETIAIRNENDEIVKFISEEKVQEYVDERIKELLRVMKELPLQSIDDDEDSIDSGEY